MVVKSSNPLAVTIPVSSILTPPDFAGLGCDSVTVDQVVAVLLKNAENACRVVKLAVAATPRQRGCNCGSALSNAILTDRARIPAATRQKLALILDKYLSADGAVGPS